MKKIFLKFHLWLSVPFGIIVTLICFSGAMLVFEPEAVKLLRHDVLYVDGPQHTALPIESLVRSVEQTLPEDVRVTGVTMFADPEMACKVNLSKPRRAAVYVDQYTGEVKGLYERPEFFATMLKLHRWLLDNRDDSGGVFWGRTVVGISTIVFVLVLLSGVTMFELGGFIGALVAGWGSDKLFNGNRGPMNLIFAAGILLSVGGLWLMPFASYVMQAACFFTTGFFVFGPQMLIGMAAAECSHKEAAGAATGFVGLFAYLGASLSGWPLAQVMDIWHWTGFFVVIAIAAGISALLLLPFLNAQAPRTASEA